MKDSDDRLEPKAPDRTKHAKVGYARFADMTDLGDCPNQPLTFGLTDVCAAVDEVIAPDIIAAFRPDTGVLAIVLPRRLWEAQPLCHAGPQSASQFAAE